MIGLFGGDLDCGHDAGWRPRIMPGLHVEPGKKGVPNPERRQELDITGAN
jgi:hypothetical protein